MSDTKNNARVAVLIACFDEEKNIAEAINSVLRQTYCIKQIICVDDASTDGTWKILKQLAKTISTLKIYRSEKKLYRAGALNFGLTKLNKDIEFILRMDADTEIGKDLIAEGIKIFNRYDDRVGGVCSKAGLKKGKGLLYRLQKLEYGAGFDAERTASFDNVMVLHGMCTLYRKIALFSVGGFTPDHLIEDYDVTVKLKEKGFKTMFSPFMEAWTRPPENLRSLIRQRLRWSKGGIDVILEHGVSPVTWEDVMDHLLFLALFLIIVTVFVSSVFSIFVWHYKPHPIALMLGAMTYMIHLYRLKFMSNLDLKDILLRSIVLPELLISMMYSGIQIYAYGWAIHKIYERR